MKIDISKGRYWDEGITLVDGCTPCSPGCEHCWSAAQAHRFRRGICYDGKVDLSVTNYTDKNGQFDGRITCNPERLKRFHTRKPKVFSIWNDLFHEAVLDEFIDEAIGYMRSLEWKEGNKSVNTYLILTKRPKRMLEYLKRWDSLEEYKIYFGLTVCNQQEADEKIPIFIQVPGKKFLSIEPCLAHIDLTDLGDARVSGAHGWSCLWDTPLRSRIDAVLLGGETGPGARPVHPDWVRSVRDQCATAGVPFFFKQMLIKRGFEKKLHPTRLLDGRTHDDLPWVKP